MTDYTKLIERLDTELLWTLNYEAQDAIKALQAESASLKQIAELNAQIAIDLKAERDQLQSKLDDAIQSSAHWQHQFTEAQAENERLKEEAKQWQSLSELSLGMAEAHSKERKALQSKLDAMGKGEPVAWRFIDDKDNGHVSYSTTPPTDAQVAYLKMWKRPAWQPLYAAPKALAPTVLKPFTPCVCHDDAAKRFCKDKGKCMYFEAHGIHAKGGQR